MEVTLRNPFSLTYRSVGFFHRNAYTGSPLGVDRSQWTASASSVFNQTTLVNLVLDDEYYGSFISFFVPIMLLLAPVYRFFQ